MEFFFKHKSGFMQYLQKIFQPQYAEPNVQVKVIGVVTFVNI